VQAFLRKYNCNPRNHQPKPYVPWEDTVPERRGNARVPKGVTGDRFAQRRLEEQRAAKTDAEQQREWPNLKKNFVISSYRSRFYGSNSSASPAPPSNLGSSISSSPAAKLAASGVSAKP